MSSQQNVNVNRTIQGSSGYAQGSSGLAQGSANYTQSSSSRGYSSSTGVRGNVSEHVVESRLSYDNGLSEQMVISGMSDIQHLRSMKNVLLNLQANWLQDGNKFVVTGDQKEDFNKRMMLLESEIEGLMKRRVNASTSDSTGRVLDYDHLMNEKENQLVELEKKINNLEDKLRRSSKREEDLEN